jgi:hypothetical protein
MLEVVTPHWRRWLGYVVRHPRRIARELPRSGPLADVFEPAERAAG